MTTFTSEDRQEAYQKKVEDAPYHPGYEDAVVPPAPTYVGMDPAKIIWKSKPLTEDEIIETIPVMPYEVEWHVEATIALVRAIEKRHGIK